MLRLDLNSKLHKPQFKNFDSLLVKIDLNPGVFFKTKKNQKNVAGFDIFFGLALWPLVRWLCVSVSACVMFVTVFFCLLLTLKQIFVLILFTVCFCVVYSCLCLCLCFVFVFVFVLVFVLVLCVCMCVCA